MMQEITQLQVGESVKLTGDIAKIRQVCTRLEHKYKVVKINVDTCLVVRVDIDIKGLKQTILDGIDSMKAFQEIPVRGNIGYIRTIVSAFNKESDRAVKVSKRGNDAVLTEDIMERSGITQSEYDIIASDFESKLLILEEKIVVDVMEEELL